LKVTLPGGALAADRSPEGAKRWRDIWSAGQGVGLIHDVKPMGALVEDIMREAHDVLRALG
jgi:nitronate monooxygenase